MTAYWIALVAAISVSMFCQELLKTGSDGEGGFLEQLLRPATMVGLVCYGGASLLYIVALRRIPMSVALPCTAASYVVIALVGHFAFGEALGPQKVMAIALISAGVVVLASA